MSGGIHSLIMEHTRDRLIRDLITNIDEDDPARAGAVKVGPFQGNPSPDVGRITISVLENDPDRMTKSGVTAMNEDWSDELEIVEIGGAATTRRRFTVKARCLFAETREDEDAARAIASTVRDRIEASILGLSFSGIRTTSEYVARNAMAEDLTGEMIAAGGPPDAFDHSIKIHFSVLTTRIGVIPS